MFKRVKQPLPGILSALNHLTNVDQFTLCDFIENLQCHMPSLHRIRSQEIKPNRKNVSYKIHPQDQQCMSKRWYVPQNMFKMTLSRPSTDPFKFYISMSFQITLLNLVSSSPPFNEPALFRTQLSHKIQYLHQFEPFYKSMYTNCTISPVLILDALICSVIQNLLIKIHFVAPGRKNPDISLV